MALHDLLHRFRRNTVRPSPELHRRIRERLAQLATPCARLVLEDSDPAPTDSNLGCRPYLPAGESWPTRDGEPLTFLAQINFSQVPPLPGFPVTGLLQWFVPDDDTYGLYSGTRAEADPYGAHLRWWADIGAPGAEPATADRAHVPEYYPVERTGRIRCEPGLSLPRWEELPEAVRGERIWVELAAAHRGTRGDAGLAYDEYAAGEDSPLPEHVPGSKVGGHARFVQDDPRTYPPYPPLGSPGGQLLVMLDSAETGGWADSGIGVLFGDPSALARGDVRSVTYSWDCG
ncbi:DUF1963 domain-containing protein [Microlunatus lacustris]